MSTVKTDTIHHGRPWNAQDFVNGVNAAGLSAHPPVLDSPSGAVVHSAGRRFVNFAGCSLLGMQYQKAVIDQFQESATRYGLATGGSRLVQGALRPHIELEELVARRTGKDSALTYASGMLANLGFIHAMGGSLRISPELSWDHDDVVFILDQKSHWSLWKAVDGLGFGRRVFAFRHNDLVSLERRLRALEGRRVVIVFESVYSDDGSIAPIQGIVDLARRFEALTYVDDANGFLAYDSSHERFGQEFAALADVTFHMVSLSKAVGLEGGAIAGPSDYIEVLGWLSGTSSFTATILPPAAAAACEAIRHIENDPSVLHRFHSRSETLRASLEQRGFTLNSTPSYITTVHIGSDEHAEQVRRLAAEGGYLVPIFRYPAVRRGHAGLRLIPTADHTEQQIRDFTDALEGIRRRVGF
ncbi:aminotransferase class I/II-fold pyridoxal phosphate-dependent enzyme [Rothia sp. AR01]|uniref:8-amino-7-oxononanoate synthase n=1 Tax=Rothia santali TaxID=2949643 RepID=A0A9X2KIB7_9MICC|nr:aminotransferase class I/II-fold pyridoxal phosphate-dependent enzyme [Rothia santali]MCP3426053.1 aminotransferase class I/II-fold pyridoxal phosphate-dependent enzyme [Rothia santali]